MRIIELLRRMSEAQAADLFLTCDQPPSMRVYGEIRELEEPPLTAADFDSFLEAQLPAIAVERLHSVRDLDVGLSLDGDERFRLNLYYQRGVLALVARRVPSGAVSFAELRVPEVVQRFAEAPRGLVLITGPTGSGKSSTMAAMLHHVNTNFNRHIVTIEDPIEFVHRSARSLVTQREVGNDTGSFASALKHVVRQSPDVIFIGELRDLDTIQTAISAAMTGHLVVTTMHTIDVSQTLERIVNYFPEGVRDQVAADLAAALTGIVAQRLLPTADGEGQVPAFEILVPTSLARKWIAGRRIEDIMEILKGGSEKGMTTFTRSLFQLYKDKLITAEVGATAATNREEFELVVQGMETGIDTLRQALGGEGDGTDVSLKRLLRSAMRHSASDMLLTTGSAPVLRIDGDLNELNLPALTGADTRSLLFSILSPAQRAQFEADREIDFALTIGGGGDLPEEMRNCRFRVNGFYQKGAVACAFRVIETHIPDREALGLPQVIVDMAGRHNGLLLITGPTGSGKSTTLACLIDGINRTRSCHIITVEDPIEYVHTSKRAIIEQREVHADTRSFATALKYVLRQDPDVILIGEMRDPETISAALTAAETGHLVLATLHTNDCAQTVDRIIDTFPAHQQSQVRAQLASALAGVVAQRLVPRADGKGRVAAFEIMAGTTAVRALIRDDRTHQIQATIETGAKDGMITMDKALLNLYQQNLITRQTVLSLARDPQIVR